MSRGYVQYKTGKVPNNKCNRFANRKKNERKYAFRPIFPKRSSATPKPRVSGARACVAVVTAQSRLAQETGELIPNIGRYRAFIT